MSKESDLRLIEDYLPIEAISKEASREKSVRKGHISTLHLWWARRPLVACRAAVYGALVPAQRWVKEINVRNGEGKDLTAFKNGAKKGLNRRAAKEFVTKLCRYPKSKPTKPQEIKEKRETEQAITDAQRHILEAHAERLTKELEEWRKESGEVTERRSDGGAAKPGWVEEFGFEGERVTYDDIVAGRAPRPRVLDMFAGGGAIPLEALRLECEAYALDLNPVAHIIQLCTLVYPQKYCKPDPTAPGITGPKNAMGETTWGGLAAEVRFWGNWVLKRVRREIGDLYPPIPDPAVWETPPEIAFDRATSEWKITKPGKPKRRVKVAAGQQLNLYKSLDVPEGFLQPLAYLWTRTVRCKNPCCGATVPLVKQTWLSRRKGRYCAARPNARQSSDRVRFDVVESDSEASIGFDPGAYSEAGNAACPFCGTVSDSDYIQLEGIAKRLTTQLMAIACQRPEAKGKIYVGADELDCSPCNDQRIEQLLSAIASTFEGRGLLGQCISPLRPSPNARGLSAITRYGFTTFADLFPCRQFAFLQTMAEAIRQTPAVQATEREVAIECALALWLDRSADKQSGFTRWDNTRENSQGTWARHALPMIWDFAEPNPFSEASGSSDSALGWITDAIEAQTNTGIPAIVERGSATSLPWADESFDALVTDPPYYDNIPYADVSDFFYVWLRRSLGKRFPQHFGADLTPKKAEATALASRYSGDIHRANCEYESLMLAAFREAYRVLKPQAPLVVVYAHKTTLGWATLVEALRSAGFLVSEAWALDTEMKARVVAAEAAALASSISLVARKRDYRGRVGNYEDDVHPELQQIVRERVQTLWELGIAGTDLVIACVGAGLRAFTKYERVEYANGEEVPAEKFLAEVEGVVLDTMLGKLSGRRAGTSARSIRLAGSTCCGGSCIRRRRSRPGRRSSSRMPSTWSWTGRAGCRRGRGRWWRRRSRSTGCGILRSAGHRRSWGCRGIRARRRR